MKTAKVARQAKRGTVNLLKGMMGGGGLKSPSAPEEEKKEGGAGGNIFGKLTTGMNV